ncbi:TetR family transcriptional regulator [Brevibacterium sp. XM4083]|uniref:TetR family transcriptional regulator n=1 Tax=Brevibacterium sp. XM4083 TaxID=2583238 RepID=UPI00112E455C|nr:TetR family transcriptional regulator [Brevibacterium sp. XM4083]MCM1012261.1 TetR family transcriptional regulator [Brevibacterium sp. XM4083]
MATSIAARARETVAGSGLSQRRLAQAIGIDETKLSKSLSGRRKFTAEELLGLATATGVTVRWLLGDESTVSAVPAGLRTASALDEADQASPRRLIVETAWDLFARHGYDAVRIADIAEAAGVSSAAVHYHFAGKSELFDATLEFSVKLAFDRQVAWLDEIVSPRRRLERLLELQSPIGPDARREWSIWIQTWSRLAVEDPAESAYPAGYDRWSRTVRATLEDGQASGVFRPGDATEMTDELTSVVDGLGIKVVTGLMDVPTFRHRLDRYLRRAIITPEPDEESS